MPARVLSERQFPRCKRDLLLLLVGQSFSQLGDGFYMTALALAAWSLTRIATSLERAAQRGLSVPLERLRSVQGAK
jgi:hypothetical protein